HKYLEEAHAAGLKGAVLIQQLLAFARKSKIVVSDIDLSELFLRLEGLLRRVLPAHITLTVKKDNQDARVRGDIAMLESAIINLVVNARDALGNQRGNIFIAVKPNGAKEVEIAVCDTGPGMDEDTLARATEPFFTTKAVGQGSGLGLSMVTGVAAQCGGRFELQNRAAGGLSARIFLPVADAHTPRRIPLEDTVGSV
ncbi:MAG: ATP-binding protein, partial [Pseudomonadota bacterium]